MKVVAAVKRLRNQFPSYPVTVTGISFGAAVAQLVSMDLKAHGVSSRMINFGQPRTGDPAYAAFAGTHVPDSWRLVHFQDPVPHMPGLVMGYSHVCHEVYEDFDGSLRVCDDSCEDPTCGDQWPPLSWNDDDHMTYLGVYMSCSSV